MGRTYYDEATSLYETLSSEVFTVLSRPFTPWSFRRLSFAALSANASLCQNRISRARKQCKMILYRVALRCFCIFIKENFEMILFFTQRTNHRNGKKRSFDK